MVKRNLAGTSLVEVMIAVMILAAMGTAITTLIIQIIALNNSARLKNQGTASAEQALEVVRSNFQTLGGYSWLSSQGAPAICDSSDCQGKTALPSLPWTGSPYASCVVINNPNASQQIKVQSLVAWLDRGLCKYTEVDTYFTNY